MKPIERLLDQLRQAGSEPVETGSGWQCSCPSHNDAKASLSIAEADDGKVLLKCHAGCETSAIVEKLDLTVLDLFPPAPAPTVYTYRDLAGHVVLEKLRYVPKRFVQRRPDGDGGYVYSLKAGWYRRDGDGWKAISDAKNAAKQPSADAKWFGPVPHVLYHLPDITAAVQAGRNILYVEGEKDADNLKRIGLDATTNSGGAGEVWRAEYADQLRGVTMIFIPDQDKAGGELFERYAPHLVAVVKEVRRLDLPDGFKDVSDWLAAGHTREELDTLIAAAPVWTLDGPVAEILDTSPETIRRPLSIVGGKAYAACWVSIRQGDEDKIATVILREDGQLFTDLPVPDALPLRELNIKVDLPHVPDPDRILSGAGVKRYTAGGRCEPAKVFERVQRVIDFYMDFDRSLGSQSELVELSALYVFVTYLLDAFNVVGYMWPNGDKGSGKTKKLIVITDLAYLGILVLAGGSYASLRDLAHYGACLGFDDAEGVMDVRRADPDKRALFLAGNRRGTYITLKEPCGDGWKSRRVHAYCPRLFSAINLPDEVLASRTIVVPLVRSCDSAKANRDPADHDAWPEDRQRLIDDLWSLGLSSLTAVKVYDRKVVDRVSLVGRNLEPWRAVLAVALWLQEAHGVAGIFDRMVALAVRYQTERIDIEEVSPVRVAIVALQRMMPTANETTIEFAPTELASAMNKIAHDEEIEHPGDTFTTAQKVGALLRRQRVDRAPRTASGKRWRIARAALDALARAYGMSTLDAPHDEPVAGACRHVENAVNADPRERVPTSKTIGTTDDATAAQCRPADHACNAGLQETPFNDGQSAPALAPAMAANDLDWSAS